MTVLILAEHDNLSLKPVTLSSVTAAKLVDDEIHILVAGSNCKSVADQAAAVPDVTEIVIADHPAYKDFLAENVAPLVAKIGSNYSHVFATSTTNAKNILPRAAALMDVQAISDISGIVDNETFERPIYAGSMIATITSGDSTKVITVRGTAFDGASETGGGATITPFTSSFEEASSEFISEEVIKSDRPELAGAKVVVSGGRALGSEEQFSLIYDFADQLGAAVGASRAAVDAGYAPNDMQVGQTGKIVAPDLYIAVGISGAIQHLAGMKDSKVIVAINKDQEAPIFSVADYGLVGDLFTALPEFEAAL
ncbi:MAG: electron transfer flavoprotein subunit alpha [Cellvibrionales bacterium TMED49]|nr:MAG: electron transfer flavoprotein subunit alpha [Cellvibrionales bacterium TMED49]